MGRGGGDRVSLVGGREVAEDCGRGIGEGESACAQEGNEEERGELHICRMKSGT